MLIGGSGQGCLSQYPLGQGLILETPFPLSPSPFTVLHLTFS